MVYKKIKCPGITKRRRTWADLLFIPVIQKKCSLALWKLENIFINNKRGANCTLLVGHAWFSPSNSLRVSSMFSVCQGINRTPASRGCWRSALNQTIPWPPWLGSLPKHYHPLLIAVGPYMFPQKRQSFGYLYLLHKSLRGLFILLSSNFTFTYFFIY